MTQSHAAAAASGETASPESWTTRTGPSAGWSPVVAGGTVDIPLTATIPGGFAVELDDSGQPLCQMRIA